MIPALIFGVGTVILFAIKWAPARKPSNRWHKENGWRE